MIFVMNHDDVETIAKSIYKVAVLAFVAFLMVQLSPWWFLALFILL